MLSIRLTKLVTTLLGDYLGGDAAFAHRLSRSPFYAGDDPTAYRWHCQHHRGDQLSHLRDEVRTMTGQTTPQPNTRPQQDFSSGRELIEAVRKPQNDGTTAIVITLGLHENGWRRFNTQRR
ncbi:replication initiation protein [uncultured Corynebacterium sp.]|uniref:replication initiation protein n=1 Tax=uncultured Corynebacterium sp. TaxID=159447 RepID=UPI0025E57367|nr:replication initiation protein [uncultured Corynebacterium sp.]